MGRGGGSLFVSCAPGIERILQQELATLGFHGTAPTKGGVAIRTESAEGLNASVGRLNLHLRTATRVLLRVAEFPVQDYRALCSGTPSGLLVAPSSWQAALPCAQASLPSTGLRSSRAVPLSTSSSPSARAGTCDGAAYATGCSNHCRAEATCPAACRGSQCSCESRRAAARYPSDPRFRCKPARPRLCKPDSARPPAGEPRQLRRLAPPPRLPPGGSAVASIRSRQCGH